MGFDYGELFLLGEGFVRGAVRVDSVDELTDALALTRGETPPLQPVRFRVDEGRDFHDLIGTTWAVLYLLSERTFGVLEQGGFTGWTSYSIEVADRMGNLIAGYCGLAVTGRCGPIEDSLSPIEILPPPVPTGEAMPHRIGLLFAPETWDRSDIFTPEGTAFVIVTEAVRNALVEAGLTNIDLRPLTEVHRLVLTDV